MHTWLALKPLLRIVAVLATLYLVAVAFVYFRQRSMLFFPSRGAPASGLVPWREGDRTIGYCRLAPRARTIWLMLHGNAGQAADRDYVLPCLSGEDSLYVLEYPGYGARAGSPSRASFDSAASEAYRLLRAQNPNTPVCVLAESIGSGPACALAGEKTPPDKIVLMVPFDSLASLASEKFPFLPVRLLLRDNWDNVESLRHYTGPVEIFAAADDSIIPIRHAKALAEQVPAAQFHEIPGRHNEWAEPGRVKIQR